MFFEKLLIAMNLKKKSPKPRHSHMARSSKKIIGSDDSDVANVMMMTSIENKVCYSDESDRFKGGAGGGFSGAGATGSWDSPVSAGNANIDYSGKCDSSESNHSNAGYSDSGSSDSSSCGGGGGD